MKDFQIFFELDGDIGQDVNLIQNYPNWDFIDDDELDDELLNECWKLVDLLSEKKIILRDCETRGFIIVKDNIIHFNYSVCTGLKKNFDEIMEEDLNIEDYKIWVEVKNDLSFSDLEIDSNDPKFSLILKD